MMWQMKVNGDECMVNVNPDEFTWIACRRGGNSAACAENVAADHRRIHGRWKSSSCSDNEYLRLHRSQFASIPSTVLMSSHGQVSGVDNATGQGQVDGAGAAARRAQGDTGRGESEDRRTRQRRGRRGHTAQRM